MSRTGPLQRSRADTVVIGGGIIGLTIAWELTRRGRDTVVLERDRPGVGASGVAAGMLAPVSEARPTEAALVAFGRDSLARYPALVAELETETGRDLLFQTGGVLLVAVDRDQMEAIEHEARNLDAIGLEYRRLSGREAAALEPRLAPGLAGALHTPGDASVDPRAVTAALVEAIERRGGRVLSGMRVAGLEREAGDDGPVRGVLVEGDAGSSRLEAPTVVVAAGAWSARALPELAHLPLRPVKGQLVRLRGEVLVGRMVRTPDVYLVPRASGELVVGASSEEQGFDDTPTAGVVLELLQEASRVLPGIHDLELAEVNVGFRPALRDNLPAIGATRVPGLYVATGHYRNGILLAPATAHHLVATMEGGAPAAELRPFAPDRFGSAGS